MAKDKRLMWNPDEITICRLNSKDQNVSFRAFRISSTGYVNKKYVRQYVFDKYHNSCATCGSNKDLHIDHIKSVKSCHTSGNLFTCNHINNLQLLCSICNLKKGK